jgi:hypothetical protein
LKCNSLVMTRCVAMLALLLFASSAMAQDVSPTTDATASNQDRDIGGRILLALKYSEPMAAYFNPKILIGSIESDVESGAWGIGLLLDSGIGNKGYKAGIGAGFFGHGYTLGSEHIILEAVLKVFLTIHAVSISLEG